MSDKLREALRKRVWFVMLDSLDREAAKSDIERGLRAAAEEMAEHGDLEWKAHTDYRAVLDRCVTAGVAAMVEEK